MTFAEKLHTIRALNIEIADLEVANSLQFYESDMLDKPLTDDEFETYASLILDCFLKADGLNTDHIAQAVLQIKAEGKNPLALSRREIIDMAYEYEY